MIPNELNITLESAAEKNAEFKRAIATEPKTKQLFEYGKILEGLSRNAGVHAAGVVIADRDLTEYIPLCRDVKGNDVISQYPMGPLNDLGLLKMDFLGLKTLTVIEDTLVLIRKREPDFSLERDSARRCGGVRALQSRRNNRAFPNGIRRDDVTLPSNSTSRRSTTSSR